MTLGNGKLDLIQVQDETNTASFRPFLKDARGSGPLGIIMDEPNVEAKPLVLAREKKINGHVKLFGQFRDILNAKLKDGVGRVGIHTHSCPDPDAIGSQMGMEWLLKKSYDVDVDMFIGGEVSHPQNLTMVNLLGTKLIPIELCHPEEYDLHILLDTMPSNAAKSSKEEVHYDIVIDHHVEMPTVENGHLYINLHTGSCCSTVHSLIKHYQMSFEEDLDDDRRVATALMVGIYTDTCGMLSDRTTESDHEAYMSLFPYRDPECLKNIAKFKRPRSWVAMKASAASHAKYEDTIAAVGLGMLSMKHRDLIADMADEMLTWEGVNISIAYAVVDGEILQGSVRSMSPSVSAAKLCKELGEERPSGSGWGHAAMGGYRYTLGGFSFTGEDSEANREETWKLLNRRETDRIFRLLKK